MSEYKKRRDNMLTYYPQVAPVGDLATALSEVFANADSSLMAYSPVPPEKPIWSIFSDHPDAPGTTVPEMARVKTGERGCQVYIGWFLVPLGTYLAEFFDSDEDDEIAYLDCWIDSTDLLTVSNIIRRTFEDDAAVSDLADEYGVRFGRRPRSKMEEEARELAKLSPEDRDRELERRRVRTYEIIGLSEERARELLSELDLEELIDSWEQATLDLKEHIGERHPGGEAPWSSAKMVRRILQKLRQPSSPDQEPWPAEDDLKARQLLVDFVVQDTAAYWSHVTDGHTPPKGTAEDYLISLARSQHKERRS